MTTAVLVRLTIAREWTLYAFPPEVVPTDERGIMLGEEELGQLVETATRQLATELEAMQGELETTRKELELLREAMRDDVHIRTLARMTEK